MTASPAATPDDLARQRAEQAQQRLSEQRYARELPPAAKPYSSTAILIYGLVISILAHAFFIVMSRPLETKPGQPVLLTALAPREVRAENTLRPKSDLGTLVPTVVAEKAPPPAAVKPVAPQRPTVRPVAKPAPKSPSKKARPGNSRQTKQAAAKPKLPATPKALITPAAALAVATRPSTRVPTAPELKFASAAAALPQQPDAPLPPPVVRPVQPDALPEVSEPVTRSKPGLLVRLPNPEGVAQTLRPNELAKMTAQLADRLIYPLAAIEQGLEGQVTVQLALKQDGSVFTARVLESSGHLTLDRAAVHAARQLPPMPAYAGGEVVLPVTFKLH